eukprot:6175346-Pleurochrysis_carterae.AAC.2
MSQKFRTMTEYDILNQACLQAVMSGPAPGYPPKLSQSEYDSTNCPSRPKAAHMLCQLSRHAKQLITDV